jgi:tRNA1Val (adenine37-N6)-methyltransferase
MSSDTFEFKNFRIRQDRCAMKVSTDAVLLGSWVIATASNEVLDIGTGTGVIALMLAQKCRGRITAIDIDRDSTEQAKNNVAESVYSDRIDVIHSSLQELAAMSGRKYNLIVSNPPYFVDSWKSNDDNRKMARHTDSLPFEDLASGALRLLDPKGKFCLILPKNEAIRFREIAESKGLFLSKLLRVRTRLDKETEKRHLMQFEFKQSEFSESTLVIETDTDRNYTPEYRDLTKDYYLHF